MAGAISEYFCENIMHFFMEFEFTSCIISLLLYIYIAWIKFPLRVRMTCGISKYQVWKTNLYLKYPIISFFHTLHIKQENNISDWTRFHLQSSIFVERAIDHWTMYDLMLTKNGAILTLYYAFYFLKNGVVYTDILFDPISDCSSVFERI